MAGILANSASKTMLAGDTATDKAVSGYLVGEQVTLTVTPSGAAFAWSMARPVEGTGRSDLSAGTGASVKFTPDAEGYYTITCLVDSVTSYTIRIATVAIGTVTDVAAARHQALLNSQIPTPSVGLTLFNSSDAGGLAVKGSDGNVTALSAGVTERYATLTALRAAAPVASRYVFLSYRTTAGDNGGGIFRGATGAAAATYVDNGGTIIVPDGGNGSAAWLRVFDGPVLAAWFGFTPAATASANVTALNAAIAACPVAAVPAASGGEVLLDKGEFSLNAGISLPNFVSLRGLGKQSTKLIFSHTGYGLKRANPVNGSYAVNATVSDLWISCTNGANTDAGFADVCGSFWYLDRVKVTGFAYGLVLDQSEVAAVTECECAAQLTAGIWLVNGPEYTVGALTEFTNRLTFRDCQINQNPGVLGVSDDGGYAHTFDNCNLNGGSWGIWSCAVVGLELLNLEIEGTAEDCVRLDFRRGLNTAVSKGTSTSTYASTGAWVPPSGKNALSIVSASKVVLDAVPLLTTGGASGIGGASACQELVATACPGNVLTSNEYPTTGRITDIDGKLLFDGNPHEPTVYSGTSVFSTTQASRFLRFTNSALVTYTLQDEAATAFPIDTDLDLEAAGAGGVVVAAAGGVTLNAPHGVFIPQYARARARKIAVNEWYLICPPRGGTATRGDVAATLTAGDAETQIWNTTLTANRTITLSTTRAWDGASFRIARPASGAFTLDVGGLASLSASQWCVVTYVAGTTNAWVLTQRGSLS